MSRSPIVSFAKRLVCHVQARRLRSIFIYLLVCRSACCL